MTDLAGTVRLSIIDYLNALPLNMAFKDGLFASQVSLTFDFPSQCADNLAAGRSDVGLISSIEYQRIPDLVIAPEVCIASHSEVRSVLLLTRKDLRDVEHIAVDRFSRTSVALLRVLFHRRFGKRPRMYSMTPNRKEMMREHDAALIIGDAALGLTTDPDVQVYDLASAWRKEVGLPFVFAFWAIHQRPDAGAVAELLAQAKAYGIKELPSRYQSIRARWNLPEDELERYFSHHLHYDLGPQQRESLDVFFRYAREANAIDQVKPLHWAGAAP